MLRCQLARWNYGLVTQRDADVALLEERFTKIAWKRGEVYRCGKRGWRSVVCIGEGLRAMEKSGLREWERDVAEAVRRWGLELHVIEVEFGQREDEIRREEVTLAGAKTEVEGALKKV